MIHLQPPWEKRYPRVPIEKIFQITPKLFPKPVIIRFYVPGDNIMHFTDSCGFLISSAFKFTALCTILPHCVQYYRTLYNLTALGP